MALSCISYETLNEWIEYQFIKVSICERSACENNGSSQGKALSECNKVI